MSYCNLKGYLQRFTVLFGRLGKGPKLQAEMDVHFYGGTGGIFSPDVDTIRVMDRADYEILPEDERNNTRILYFLRG